MTRDRAERNAWAMLAAMVLGLAGAALGMLMRRSNIHAGVAVYALVLIAGTALSLYVLRGWWLLLREIFSFHKVDKILEWLAALVVMVSVVMLFNGFVVQTHPLFSLIVIPFAMASAVLRVLFAKELLELDEPTGLIRPYCFVTMAEAVCMFTVCLAPLAALVSVASATIGAMFFFRISRRIAATPPAEPSATSQQP